MLSLSFRFNLLDDNEQERFFYSCFVSSEHIDRSDGLNWTVRNTLRAAEEDAAKYRIVVHSRTHSRIRVGRETCRDMPTLMIPWREKDTQPIEISCSNPLVLHRDENEHSSPQLSAKSRRFARMNTVAVQLLVRTVEVETSLPEIDNIFSFHHQLTFIDADKNQICLSSTLPDAWLISFAVDAHLFQSKIENERCRCSSFLDRQLVNGEERINRSICVYI